VYSLRHLESSACRGSLRPGRRAPAHRDDVIEMVAPFLPCLLPCRPCLLLLLRAHERLDEPQPPNARRGAGRRAGGHWVGGIILISIQPALLLALSRKADSNSGREQNLEKSVFSSSSSRPGALQAPTRPTTTQTTLTESTMPLEPPEPIFTMRPVALDAALGTARGYGQSTPRELQLPCAATLSSAKLRATSTGPRAQAPAGPA